jgi:hypothetical protein
VYLDALSGIDQDFVESTESARTSSLVGFTGFQSTGYHASEMSSGEKQKTSGVVVLTKALEEKVRMGQLARLDEITVASYLRDHMTWKVAMVRL